MATVFLHRKLIDINTSKMLPLSAKPRPAILRKKWPKTYTVIGIMVFGTLFFLARCFSASSDYDTSGGSLFKYSSLFSGSRGPMPISGASLIDHLQSKEMTDELREYYKVLAETQDRLQPPYFIDFSNFPIYPVIDCTGREETEECMRQTRNIPRAPSTREELGHGTWNFLHRMAAQYDKEPTPERQEDMRMFIKLFGDFYPCPDCSAHFREMIKEHPPDVSSNWNLSIWFCKVHNIVNERLGKPQFPCDIESIKTKWGDCGCLNKPPESQ